MPLPTIADTFRLTLNFEKPGVPSVHNVVHIRATGGSFADVRAWVQSSNPWGTDCFLPLSEDYILNSVTVVPLDGGASASLLVTLDSPVPGGAGGQPILELAAVTSFYTLHPGQSGHGRIFLGPTTEDIWNGGALVYDMPAVALAWEQFSDAVDTEFAGGAQVVASYTDEAAYTVVQWTPHAYGATQRRRLVATR